MNKNKIKLKYFTNYETENNPLAGFGAASPHVYTAMLTALPLMIRG